MTHSSPSAMTPNGAMWTVPVAFIVVTIVSRIIGIGSLRWRRAQRVPGLAQTGEVFFLRLVDRAAPIERLVLHVALAEAPRDLGPHQLRPQIERMRAVLLDAELGEQGQRILRDLMPA